MYYLTHTQKTWLNTATPEQKDLFMAHGPAGCVITTQGRTIRYAPMIRGIQLNGDHALPEQAVEAAKLALSGLKARTMGVAPLDESNLGIDGLNARHLEQCDRYGLRIMEIFHLASVIGTEAMETSFHEPIDELVRDLAEGVLLHESARVLVPLDSTDRSCLEDFKLHLHSLWLAQGLFGFAVLAAVPAKNPLQPWTSSRIWVYAETYTLAFELALAWAKEAA